MTDWYKIKRVRIRQNWVEKQVRPPIPATAITLDKSSINFDTAGQTEQITATLTPADSTSTVSWSSSDTTVATVSSTGLVTCVTPWTCTITATTDNGLTATCWITNNWQPWANTVAYYPLVEDVLDYSGNGNNWTWNPNSFTWWVANYSWASTTIPYSIIYRDTYTVNLWVNSNQAQSQRGVLNQHTQVSWWFYLSVFKSWWWVWWRTWPWGSDYNDISDSTPLIWWHLITCQVVWGGKKIYVDGVLKASSNYVGSKMTDTLYIWYDHWANGWAWNGKVSKIIVENRAWTQSEIAEYYNQTKSNYWL